MASVKLGDVIADVKLTNRGKYTDETIVHWINECEEKIFNDVILTHFGEDDIIESHTDDDGHFVLYGIDDTDKEMIVPSMYSSVYKNYVDSQIYYTNSEMQKYNNATTKFNASFRDYNAWYNRTHKPKGKKFNFFGG